MVAYGHRNWTDSQIVVLDAQRDDVMKAGGTIMTGERVLALWQGIIPALVTPLREDGSVDTEGIERLVRYVTEAGVHAVSIGGSTGVGALLPEASHSDTLSAARRAAGGRPIIAGVLESVPDNAFAAARRAFEGGADAVLLTPPFYYRLDQAAVVAFYAEAARRLPGPIFVYHIPNFTKVTLDLDTVSRLAEIPRLAGLKDSSRDLTFHQAILDATRGGRFAIFAGAGDIIPLSHGWGGAGAIAASGNLVPGALVELWNAAKRGASADVERLQAFVSGVEELCRRFPFPVNWQTAVELAGVAAAVPAFPLRRLPATDVESMRAGLVALGLISSRTTSG